MYGATKFHLQVWHQFFLWNEEIRMHYLSHIVEWFWHHSVVYRLISPGSSHRMLLPRTVPWLWEPLREQPGNELCSCSVGGHWHQTLVQPPAGQSNTLASTLWQKNFCSNSDTCTVCWQTLSPLCVICISDKIHGTGQTLSPDLCHPQEMCLLFLDILPVSVHHS